MKPVRGRRVSRADAESIVRDAFTLFRQRGYDSTSIEDIARQAQVAKPSLYRYFSGKEGILAAGVERPLSALMAVFDEPSASSGSYVERLAFVLRRTVEIEAEFLPQASVLVRLHGDTLTERHVTRCRREFERRVAVLVAHGVEHGELRDDIPPTLQARLLLSLTNWIVVWFDEGGAMTAPELAEHVLEFSYHGLRPNVDITPDQQ